MKMLSFLFTLIFFIQTNAWAVEPNQIQKAVEVYNSLSDAEKIDLLRKIYTPADLQVLKQHADLNKLKLPKVAYNKNELSFSYNKKQISFSIKDKFVIQFKNKNIDLSPGNLVKAIDELEKSLTPEFSLLDVMIAPSYAAAGALIAIVMLLVFGSVLAINRLAAAFDIVLNACDDAKEKFHDELPGLTSDGAKELDAYLKETLIDLGYACRTRQSAYELKLCDQTVVCLNDLKKELDSKGKTVNNSDRKLIKDYVPPVTKEAWPLPKKSSQQ